VKEHKRTEEEHKDYIFDIFPNAMKKPHPTAYRCIACAYANKCIYGIGITVPVM
jgi:hypothetical protein